MFTLVFTLVLSQVFTLVFTLVLNLVLSQVLTLVLSQVLSQVLVSYLQEGLRFFTELHLCGGQVDETALYRVLLIVVHVDVGTTYNLQHTMNSCKTIQ